MQSFFKTKEIQTFEQPTSLWQRVLVFLRNAIVKGELEPGEKLNEVLIASKLGVSRSPVREAIRVLESQNFVETIDRRGTFVKILSVREVEEIYIVLKFLLSAAVSLAVRNMDEKKKKEITSIIKESETARNTTDKEKLKCISKKFHTFIMEAGENNLLLKINESLLVQEERIRLWGISTVQEDITAIIDEHILISRSILKEDASEADRLMQEHVEKARERILNAILKRKKD